VAEVIGIDSFHCTKIAYFVVVVVVVVVVCVSSFLHFPDNDDLIARTTIVGIVLAFRKLTLDALHNVSYL